MKSFIFFILAMSIGIFIFHEEFESLAAALSLSIAFQILIKSNDTFVFREWALFLYSLNYLLSPAISYHLESEKVVYAMKITSSHYFSMAIPGFLLLAVGMYIIPSKIFKTDLQNVSKMILTNERFFIRLTLFGILLRLTTGFFSSGLTFFFYLISLLRFVGAFALFGLSRSKYGYLVFIVVAQEVFFGFRSGMFHDAIMWVVFFALFYLYLVKPTIKVKLIGLAVLTMFVLLIQSFKQDYRQRVWEGGESANISTITDVTFSKTNSDILLGDDNLLSTLNRGNQAWIFASTVDNMDRTKDFQGLNNIYLYLESALLPRFLAPNKITSGDRFIFNKFSGHFINEGTAMGLGVFADGYIAFGKWGVMFFCLFLGLLFSIVFRIIESWVDVSPFYVLLILPILNYAVRPDCELQTIINHIVKSLFAYGLFVKLTKYRFTLQDSQLLRK